MSSSEESESSEILLVSSKTGNQNKEQSDSSDIEISPLPILNVQNRRKSPIVKVKNKKTKLSNTVDEEEPYSAGLSIPLQNNCTDLPVPLSHPKTIIPREPDLENESSLVPLDQSNANHKQENDKIKIICRDKGRERAFYLLKEETLEVVCENYSPEAKIKYNRLFVSKYLSIEDLNCYGENNVFEIIGNTNDTLDLKINLDRLNTLEINVNKSLQVKDIFGFLDNSDCKENLLILNGFALEEDAVIENVLEDGDVLDYV